MKKIYVIPNTEVIKVCASPLMVVSQTMDVSETKVDNGLSRESGFSWNQSWDDEEIEEDF